LEALYQLTELGETPSNNIAAIHSAVGKYQSASSVLVFNSFNLISIFSDVLVNLVSVDAQSYGPESLKGIKVVELIPATGAVTTIQSESQPSATPVAQQVATPEKTTSSMKAPTPHKPPAAVKSSTPLSSSM
jgi:hypothetical protein